MKVGGKPSLINIPASLGALVCGEENSIGCRDVRCSHLIDKVKERVVAYWKVLRTLTAKKQHVIPPV